MGCFIYCGGIPGNLKHILERNQFCPLGMQMQKNAESKWHVLQWRIQEEKIIICSL